MNENSPLSLSAKIESILFWKNEPMKVGELTKLLGVSEDEIKEAGKQLSDDFANRGIKLVISNDGYSLATAPEMSSVIETCITEELSKDLGKASLETLAIIAYRNGATRSDIDYIRGVNSSFVLRNLQIRGLISREHDAKDERRFTYSITSEALRYLGVESVSQLPDFDTLSNELLQTAEAQSVEQQAGSEDK